jgi:DUF4097 and DUF4098 domain-containing protein YvlB
MRYPVEIRNLAAAAGLFLFTTVCAQGWQERLTREGPYWIQTVSGTEALPPNGRLRISTSGRVNVKGGGETQVSYQFTKRAKARTEAEARKLLGQFVVQSFRRGDITNLEVIHASGQGLTELQISVPKDLREMAIETRGGAVEVVDLNGALTTHSGGGRIRLDRVSGPVIAKTAGGDIHLGTIQNAVRCISAGGSIRAERIGGEARFETAGGDIVVREVLGKVYAATAGGGINIGNASSTVSVNTAGGLIHIGSARGMVVAESLGGPIQIGAAPAVRCETGGGAIHLSNISGVLRASTVVGNIVASVRAASSGEESYLATGAGDITVFLPSNLGVTIQAQSQSNSGTRRIVSDFPGVNIRREGTLTLAEGSLNGGGPVIRLSGTGGTIYIKRLE